MTGSASADNYLLHETLQLAVPMWIDQVKDLPFGQRARLAAESSAVVASQGDTLQYGSTGTKFGDGAREERQHQAHGDAKDGSCATCAQGKDQARCCMRRFQDICGACKRGQVTYSAGEAFNFMARGLAVLACQPGGVTYHGMHWCAWPHPRCPNPRTPRKPSCCTCDDGACPAEPAEGNCRGCIFCANGCVAAADDGRPCCRTAPAPGSSADRHSDGVPADPVVSITVTSGRL